MLVDLIQLDLVGMKLLKCKKVYRKSSKMELTLAWERESLTAYFALI